MAETSSASAGLVGTARSLWLDTVAAECIEALRAAGVRPILLKGPALATLLYGDGSPRPYGDCDLLVDPARRAPAEAALTELGYLKTLGERDLLGAGEFHAHSWVRMRDGAYIDLHANIAGAEEDQQMVWEVLSAGTKTLVVGGVEAEVLDGPRTCLLLGVHAAAHGPHVEKPLADLGRGLAALDEACWTEAARLAELIGAEDAFAAGLRLAPNGRALAHRLGLRRGMPVEMVVQMSGGPTAAIRIEHLTRASGPRGKAAVLARVLVPTWNYMRVKYPLARRGGFGLALAYPRRWLTLPVRSIPAVRAWRQARRATGAAEQRNRDND